MKYIKEFFGLSSTTGYSLEDNVAPGKLRIKRTIVPEITYSFNEIAQAHRKELMNILYGEKQKR